MNTATVRSSLNIIVIVAALGYFVDIYDLILFSVVRESSLRSLGFSGEALLDKGVFLLNCQMLGMLAGGIVWGVLGDKKGRVSVLFGSILMYSVANILNGMVTSVEMYALLRFVAGIGLAGELGAGITLVSETMTRENRGYGTMIVVSVGVLGAVLAGTIAKFFSWQTCYYIGGVLGLALLALRIGVYESGMYESVKQQEVRKGSFLHLFTSPRRLLKYLNCILIGLPIWFAIGVLVTLAPEFARAVGITVPVSAGTAIMYFYGGTAFGDFMSGYLSQVFRNRKKIVYLYMSLMVVSIPLYLLANSASVFYLLCALLGVAAGYWAVFVTIASEQFGTNIRSTVTTTVPNFVRGGLVLLSSSFQFLKPHVGIVNSAMIVGGTALCIAYLSLSMLDETYGKDLDYVEMM
jgi:MFS transporter, putative metabolite:H+ symporter